MRYKPPHSATIKRRKIEIYVKIRLFLWLSAIGLIWAAPSWSRTIHVPMEATTIQAGVESSSNGDTVIVSPGVYVENVNFLGKAIVLASEYLTLGDSQSIINTIIDGDTSALGLDSFMSCVYFINGETTASDLGGVTLRNGRGSFEGGFVTGFRGGGVYCRESSPTIRNCIFRDNEVDVWGGAVFCWKNGSPHIIDCLIEDNFSKSGGAIMCGPDTYPVVSGCVLRRNGAFSLDFFHSFPTITNCQITETLSDAVVINNCIGSISDCILGKQKFRTMFLKSSIFTVSNCIFKDGEGAVGAGAPISEYLRTQTGTYEVLNSMFMGGSMGTRPALLAYICSTLVKGCTFANMDGSL